MYNSGYKGVKFREGMKIFRRTIGSMQRSGKSVKKQCDMKSCICYLV